MRRFLLIPCIILGLVVLYEVGATRFIELFISSTVSTLATAVGSKSTEPGNAIEQQIHDQASAQCAQALAENKSLTRLLDYRTSSIQKGITARVLGKTTEPERSMIVIDRGSYDGIAPGYPVIADAGILVGRVASVREHRSFVTLLSDSRSKVLAAFAHVPQPRGIVEGQFQLGLKMERIPIEEKLEKEMVVMTSGAQLGMPAGLVIGSVADIRSKPTDLFQSIRVMPSIPYDTLQYVSVLVESHLP